MFAPVYITLELRIQLIEALMQLELSLSFCLQWGKYFMFVLGNHEILILARNTFQNKPPGIQPLLKMATWHPPPRPHIHNKTEGRI